MADLQKTIKGLRCHSEPKFGPDEYFYEVCPYDEATCGLDVPNDALSLLKAQEPAKPVAIFTTGNGCSSADCPRCKKRINNWHNPFFCGNCGQAVKWNA